MARILLAGDRTKVQANETDPITPELCGLLSRPPPDDEEGLVIPGEELFSLFKPYRFMIYGSKVSNSV
jgi:hypothetical protein